MKTSRPFKDKPWLVLEESGFWESLFCGYHWRLRLDTSHPEWFEKVFKPTIEKLARLK